MSDFVLQLVRAADARHRADDRAEALALYLEAAAAAPDNPVLRYNAANLLRELKRFDEAVARYDEAIAMAPEFAIAHHNRALCFLQVGDLRTGFREYEWRKDCPTFEDPRYGLPRQWAGEPLAGRSLFIYPELYQGDLIQFCRYARLAEMTGARVSLGAPLAMHALLRTLSPTLELLPAEATPDDYDYASALMSLPAGFGTTLETVPRGVYLQADSARVARWRERIGLEGLKIGVVWQGSARAAHRSFPLASLQPLAEQPGVRLISLQKHEGLEQLASLPPGMTVESLGDGFDPGPDAFVDTAAAMVCCDLVISPDTSAAHLAGALGVRTWLALNEPSDWRWLDGREDSPWYPSMRLFRQPSRGDWPGVFARMAEAIRRGEGARSALSKGTN